MSKIINVDYDGRPEYALSIKDIIESFGAVYNEQTDKWEIANSDKLDVCPSVCKYNIAEPDEPQYLISGNFANEDSQFNFFRDKEIEHIDICESVGVYPGSIIKGDDDTEYVVFNVIKLNENYIFQCYEFGFSNKKDLVVVEFSIDEVKQMISKYKK